MTDRAAPASDARVSAGRVQAAAPASRSEPPPKPDAPSALAAVRAHPRAGDLASLAAAALGAAARARRAQPERTEVASEATALDLAPDATETSHGNVFEVLAAGPTKPAERALAQALARAALDGALADGDEAEPEDVEGLLWLAGASPFDALALPTPPELAPALETVCARLLREGAPGVRGPRLVAAAVLASRGGAPADDAGARALASTDDALVRGLVARGEPTADTVRVEGLLVAAPGRTLSTLLLGMTGLLAVARGVEIALRGVLRLRRVVELRADAEGVRLRVRRELLGRLLDERELRVPARELARIERVVRYPRLAFYAGLTALALGSFVGVRTLVDGARAASPSLLAWGLGFVAAGFGLELLLRSVLPGVSGTVSLVLETRAGRVVVVSGLAREGAERAARVLGAATRRD